MKYAKICFWKCSQKMPASLLKLVKIKQIYYTYRYTNQSTEYIKYKNHLHLQNVEQKKWFDNVALIKIDACIVYVCLCEYFVCIWYFFHFFISIVLNGNEERTRVFNWRMLATIFLHKTQFNLIMFHFLLLPVTIYSCFVRVCWFSVTHLHCMQ